MSSSTVSAARVSCMVLAAGLSTAASAELSNQPLLGPGLRSRPAYDGAADQKTEVVPVVRYFGRYWFVRSTQGVLETGGRTELAPGLFAGAQLAYEPGRQSGDSAFLRSRGVPDIDRGASLGLQLEWDHQVGPVPVTLLSRARRNTDSGLGTQADFRLSAGVFQSGRFGAGIFTQATWADAKSTRASHGVSPALSASSGLPISTPGSGLLFSSAGVLWSVDLNSNWVVVGSLESRRLHGAAARSPLTQDASNHYVSAGIAYKY